MKSKNINAFQFYEAVFNSALYSIIATDVNGVIKLFNSGAEKMLGYKASEVIDLQTPAIIHDLNEVVAHAEFLSKELSYKIEPGFEVFVAKAKLGGHEEKEWTYIRKDGTRLPVLLSVTALRDETGVLNGYLGIARDITSSKSLEKELEVQRASSLNSMKMATLGEMAGGIAHEINNPLAIIQGRITQMRRFIDAGDFDKDKFLDRLQKIEFTANRIAKIIRGLRVFARDAEGDPFEPVSVEKVVRDTVEFCSEKLNSRGIHLQLPVFLPEMCLFCRETQISQVLLNLINNSSDAIEKLTEKWVRVEVSVTQDLIAIRVVDSGNGIPKNVQEKIMQPFFTTKEVGKGTGLGLSIAKGIIDSHGGKLWIDNNCKNTCFVIELPRYQGAVTAA